VALSAGTAASPRANAAPIASSSPRLCSPIPSAIRYEVESGLVSPRLLNNRSAPNSPSRVSTTSQTRGPSVRAIAPLPRVYDESTVEPLLDVLLEGHDEAMVQVAPERLGVELLDELLPRRDKLEYPVHARRVEAVEADRIAGVRPCS
jgi:hypothetical protein